MTMSEAEFERQYIEATRRGAEELRTLPLAKAVRFDARTRRVIIDTNKGFTVCVPTDLLQGLRGAAVKDLSQVEIMGEGQAIEWPTVDQQFSMTGLLSGRGRDSCTVSQDENCGQGEGPDMLEGVNPPGGTNPKIPGAGPTPFGDSDDSWAPPLPPGGPPPLP